jgi:hypothetical protein
MHYRLNIELTQGLNVKLPLPIIFYDIDYVETGRDDGLSACGDRSRKVGTTTVMSDLKVGRIDSWLTRRCRYLSFLYSRPSVIVIYLRVLSRGSADTVCYIEQIVA